ncbi:MAG: hypothetical protein ACKOA6_07005, partial [Actinomycetota bacterium]
ARLADGWSGFGPPERWSRNTAILDGLRSRDLVRSVLLTIHDEPVHLDDYVKAGVDHVVRSVPPEADGTFELAPIAALLTQRIGLSRRGSQ